MSIDARTNAVHRSLNKPLTILGLERRLFFSLLVIAGATFNFFGSLLDGLFMFVALFLSARFLTAKDPQLLRILLNASKFKSRYDPGKWTVVRKKGVTLDD